MTVTHCEPFPSISCRGESLRIRRGLTLMELVVVLAILAALATAATVATERVLMQRRFEITQHSLGSFRRAVLGQYGTPESTAQQAAAMEGFVADLGRLPVAAGNDPEFQLAELWARADVVAPYGMKTSASDPEVSLPCGWRGPYLELPVGASGLLDGWGRRYEVIALDVSLAQVPAADGDTIFGLRSLGSDGVSGFTADSPPLGEDLTVLLLDASDAKWSAQLNISVHERDEFGELIAPQGNGDLIVRVYGAGPTGQVAHVESSMLTGPFTTPPEITFEEIPIGPKVLRAYWQYPDTSGRNSVPMSVKVTQSGVSQFQLILPAGATIPAEEEEP